MENDSWFEDSIEGSKVLAIVICVVAIALGVLPGIFCKERFVQQRNTPCEKKSLRMVLGEFIKTVRVFITPDDLLD